MKPILEIRDVSKQFTVGPHQNANLGNLRELLQSGFMKVLRRAKPGQQNSVGFTFWALKDVSLTVNNGDVVGIIGRNGAGKSTLLKVLSRITSPTEGEVKIRGRLSSLLEVGTGFHPELTGRENIFLNGAILGMRKREIVRHFDEIVAFAEVEKFLDTPVKHYSSGMYVRLAFAVAAHLSPEILIVDEVLAVGDLAFQKKCLGKMGEVSRGGRTVLFVSHNMAAVENLCSRAIVLSGGRLHFDGGTKDAIHYYLNTLSTQSGLGSVIDLDNVGERSSTLGPLLKRLEFLTDGDQPLNQGIAIGGRLKVKVHFELPSLTDMFNIGIGFNNIYGQRMFTASTLFEPNISEKQYTGRQVYCCDIPSFTLTPGEYSVKIWLDLKHISGDSIEDAARITVLESDFYGTGKVPWNGNCVMKHSWQLEEPVREAMSALGEQAGS